MTRAERLAFLAQALYSIDRVAKIPELGEGVVVFDHARGDTLLATFAKSADAKLFVAAKIAHELRKTLKGTR